MRRFLDSDFIQTYRGILIPVAALFVAWILYPKPQRDIKNEGITEIVYWTPGSASDSMKLVVKEFERRNPQYRVTQGTATVRDSVGDPTRFLLGVAGGVPPDLIFFDRFAVVEWASRGAFTDLSPFIERDKDHPDAIKQENFVEPAWNEPIYKGKIYALANSVDTRALYYNSDELIRAGLVYTEKDSQVLDGKVKAGSARPPETWEELCLKRIHAKGEVRSDGTVRLKEWVRRSAVNEQLPKDAQLDLTAYGVKEDDVVTMVSGNKVFRARLKKVVGETEFVLDLRKDLASGITKVPSSFVGSHEIKIFDQESYIVRLTRYNPETGVMLKVGFIPLYGNSWLYMYGWLNGGKFMNDDGTSCLLDSHEIVVALQYMTDMYDVLGGKQDADVFRQSAESGPLNPFLAGKIAMVIHGDWFLRTISEFKPELNFGVVVSPIPEKRKKAGFPSYGWLGGWAYAIPSTAKEKDGGWELARWLCSVDANKIVTEFEASLNRAKGQKFFPRPHPDYRIMKWMDEEFLQKDPSISDNLREGYRTMVKLLPTSKYRPVTPVGQQLWTEHRRAMEAAISHDKYAYDALNYGKRQVQLALDRHLHPPEGRPVPWNGLIVVYALIIVGGFVTLILVEDRKCRIYGGDRSKWIGGYLCASPWIFGFILFGGGPIAFSLIISFCHYDVLNEAKWIGISNYVNLLGSHFDEVTQTTVQNDPLLWKSLKNTAFMIVGVPLGIVIGLALALLLDTKVKGLHVYRTIYYLPAIVPAVASFILWLWIFDPSRGLVNQMLAAVGVTDPPNWLQDPVWSKPSLILMGLWGVGSSMIIWLAGLKDIPESLHEAAAIDGANRWQRFWLITIPMLSPYIFFNLIMGMIGVFQIFEAAYVMTDGGPQDSTLFYAYKLFNEAFRYLNMGAASSMAWILFVLVLVVTLLQLWLSKKWVHYER
ncbi:MAG: extracellular solute-binding protein [Planctomycetota bacterium]|nr:extracellular solute-binding protein [Planctomycetota bacterium]MDA1141370.1 extracellular solute-binding protein [Planctomycetota bacterium]